MQIQSNLGLAGIGATKSPGAPAPTSDVPETPPEASISPEREARERDDAAVRDEREEAPPPADRPKDSPRARLAYDRERREVYVEVLDRSSGDVLFTFPANQAKDALPGGLSQGALVDESV